MRTLLAVMAVWALAVLGGPTFAATITVDDDGPADYDTIQEAVDHSSPGDTILVMPGLYAEEVRVPHSLAIIGSGIRETIVVPATSRPGSGPGSQIDTTAWVFRLAASDVTIASLTVDGDNPDIGVEVDARGGIITDYTAGTFDRLLVSGVEVDGVAYRGIYAAAGGSGHQFFSNEVRNITQRPLDSVGIFFYGAQGIAESNTVETCSIGLGFQSGGGGTMRQNHAAGCDLAIFANGSNVPVTFEENDFDGCEQGIQSIAVNTTVTIARNQGTTFTWGITCFGLGSGSNLIDENTLDGGLQSGTYGLWASTDVSPWGYGDVRATVTRNQFIGNEYAVVLEENAADLSPLVDVLLSGDPSSYNIFSDSLAFNLYLERANDDIDATYNFWGVASDDRIEASIYHQVDDPALGLVDFTPPLNLIVTVDDDGGADFLTIVDAVPAVWPGGTIKVFPGSYLGEVVIDRALLLQGSGTSEDPAEGTIVNPYLTGPNESAIAVVADDVTIENLRVDGWVMEGDNKVRRGIYGNTVERLTVRDCVVHGAVSGIPYVSSQTGLFLRNEVYDFGRSLNEGGGIFLWNSTGTVGTPGDGNYAHDGLATGIIFHNSSSGIAEGNRVARSALGYLCNGCSAPTTIRDNEARDSDQGYQSIANNFPITYEHNTAFSCDTGFTLFPLNDQLHTYTRNFVDGGGSASQGLYVTTECIYGDEDVHALLRGNAFTGSAYGMRLYETDSSNAYLMDVDAAGASSPNIFANNIEFDVYLEDCNDDIDATGNQWVTENSAEIETRIWHKNDDPALGLVTYSSFQDYGPELHMSGWLELNYMVAVTHIGLPNELVVMFYSTGTGYLPTPFGDLLLDLSFFKRALSYTTGPTGLTTLSSEVGMELPPGLTFYFQSFVTQPGYPPAWLTNLAELSTR
ncbi:MAG: right-handed parallel beta-helix repeat-containing protein [Planctomycetota bacterium]